ncbi:MAG: hypothetical protein K0V04_01145 [Deltaproteobacteria bacterium]|nr:hypothetical protein [Deltaproteobacteria bacterium]
MTFEYVSVEEAKARGGLRMVVVSGIPSAWSEAVKGMLHMEGVPWVAVRLAYDSEALVEWAGRRHAPVAIYDDERPRDGWAQIALLVQRLAARPSLIPSDPAARALVFGLAHEMCGEQGLGWSRRLQAVHAGLHGAGGFPERVAKYLGRKYGYRPQAGEAAGDRVAQLLGMFAAHLRAQRDEGRPYYVGEAPTIMDIYSAAFIAMFSPLPQPQCAMDPTTRTVFETLDDQTRAALDPILIEHRDMMYAQHLELPLSL